MKLRNIIRSKRQIDRMAWFELEKLAFRDQYKYCRFCKDVEATHLIICSYVYPYALYKADARNEKKDEFGVCGDCWKRIDSEIQEVNGPCEHSKDGRHDWRLPMEKYFKEDEK